MMTERIDKARLCDNCGAVVYYGNIVGYMKGKLKKVKPGELIAYPDLRRTMPSRKVSGCAHNFKSIELRYNTNSG